MNERIKDKIKEIERYLNDLEEIKPSNIQSYAKDFKTKTACERYAERIIEAITDLALLLIKEKGLSLPENDIQTFDILLQNNIISAELTEKLKNAKRMRNIIAHKYGEIDDEIIFNAIKKAPFGR